MMRTVGAEPTGWSWSAPVWPGCRRRCIWPGAAVRSPWSSGKTGPADAPDALDIGGYQLDTGPTVLTMPDIIDDAFAAVGENRSARLDLMTVDPAYRAQFADGSSSRRAQRRGSHGGHAIREFAGAKQAAGYRKLRDWLTRLYQTEFDGFIAENFDSPLSLVNPQLARLAALGGFRKWDTMVNRHISDASAAASLHLPVAVRRRGAASRPWRSTR